MRIGVEVVEVVDVVVAVGWKRSSSYCGLRRCAELDRCELGLGYGRDGGECVESL
jgi:hypothetical protein